MSIPVKSHHIHIILLDKNGTHLITAGNGRVLILLVEAVVILMYLSYMMISLQHISHQILQVQPPQQMIRL